MPSHATQQIAADLWLVNKVAKTIAEATKSENVVFFMLDSPVILVLSRLLCTLLLNLRRNFFLA
jgi:hypothetical protein